MRSVQVIPYVTLKSYLFFKPLNFCKSNGQKRYLLILIFWLGTY